MSGQRPRSPGFRRFPWEEPDFDPYKVLEELDEDQMDSRSNWSREGSGDRLGHFRVDIYAEGQRRSSSFSGDRPFGHPHHSNQDEFYHSRPLPRHKEMLCADRRTSSTRDGGVDGDRRRGGFQSHSFGNRGRSPHSPPRFMRERLPSMPQSRSEHHQREPERGLGWRKEEQGTAPSRHLSPSRRSEDQRRRNPQCPSRDGQRHGSRQERNPPFKRQRRETDDGFRTEKEFMDQHHPVDLPRYRFARDAQETLLQRDVDHSGPLVVEHDHGMAHSREASQWQRFNDGRDPERQRSPRDMSSSQEHFRVSDRRLDVPRGRQDNWSETNYHESRSGPSSQNGTHAMRYGSQDGPLNYRGRAGPLSARGQDGHSEGGRTGPQRNQTQLQQSSRGNQDRPRKEQRLGYRAFKDKNPVEGDAGWSQETRPQWKHDRHGSLDRHRKTERIQGWKCQKDMAVETEETLTIKVDMSQPVHQNSLLCYSSDRQLSLDLVNVGRQRLDFLPMLEHSGTYRETAIHTGTFAQEIITLVHHVKEQYFRDAGITLNQRFSALPTGSQSEAETAELTLDQRFSSKRGFSLKMSSLLDDDEPLFSRLEPLPPVRGPGDLRHDLDRKRQERLEGVKVTISGNILSQHPVAPFSALTPEFTHKDHLGLMVDEGSCNWRQFDNIGSSGGGASYSPTSGFQRKNTRFTNRLGPMRQQNNCNNTKGPHW